MSWFVVSDQFLQAQFVFESPMWNLCIDVTAQLRSMFRQKDERFQALLGRARLGQLSQADVATLHSRIGAQLHLPVGLTATRLYPDNASVDEFNSVALARIAVSRLAMSMLFSLSVSKGPVHTFRMKQWFKEGRRDALLPIRKNIVVVRPWRDDARQVRRKDAAAGDAADHVEMTEQTAFVEAAKGAEVKERSAISAAAQTEGVA